MREVALSEDATSSPSGADLRMDAATVRRWCSAAVDALGAHRDEIDLLNVFPVPDGDTGTNMLLTLRAMTEALRRERPTDVSSAAAVIARGALLGARGNSGVILSQFVRGMAEILGELDDNAIRTRPTSLLAESLSRGAELARKAVSDPVEGTILTVADRAAEGARDAAARASLDMAGIADVATAAAAAAAAAVTQTQFQLPALTRAKVVDAGGRGLSIIFDALAAVTGGRPAGGPSWARKAPTSTKTTDLDEPYGAGHDSDGFSYEVVYLLDAQRAAVANLEDSLRSLGDSVVIAEGNAIEAEASALTWRIHVHVNDVGAAIEAGIEAGRPHRIEVTRFEDQRAGGLTPLQGVAVVAIAPGDALRSAFLGEGVTVVDSGPARRPSTAEVLAAIQDTHAAHVVVLPNDGDCTAVADAAASEARTYGHDVAVVPTKSVMQGLAAVAVHDAERRFNEDVIAMAEAAAATRFADIAVAAREALTMAGHCHPGDVIGSIENEVVKIGSSVLEVALDLLDRFLATGGELVTVAVSPSAPDELADDLSRDIATRHPEVEVSILAGGHPDHLLLLGVE